MSCNKCGSPTHRDDAMNSRCNSCEHLVRLCICNPKGNTPLMERTFRPKGTSVKAVQVNIDTIDYAADWCAGVKDTAGDALDASVNHSIIKVPTLDGVKLAKMGDYIVRVKGEGFKVMPGQEFEDRYEPVRTTRSDS